jgi:hypothetical protein
LEKTSKRLLPLAHRNQEKVGLQQGFWGACGVRLQRVAIKQGNNLPTKINARKLVADAVKAIGAFAKIVGG